MDKKELEMLGEHFPEVAEKLAEAVVGTVDGSYIALKTGYWADYTPAIDDNKQPCFEALGVGHSFGTKWFKHRQPFINGVNMIKKENFDIDKLLEEYDVILVKKVK